MRLLLAGYNFYRRHETKIITVFFIVSPRAGSTDKGLWAVLL